MDIVPENEKLLLEAPKPKGYLPIDGLKLYDDDVKALAHATLAHRLSLRPEAELEGVGVAAVLDSALGSVPVPR